MIKHLVPRLLAGFALASLLFGGVASSPSGATGAPRYMAITARYLGHYKYEVSVTLGIEASSYEFPRQLWISAPTSSPLACNKKVLRLGTTKCEVNLSTSGVKTAEIEAEFSRAYTTTMTESLSLSTHLPASDFNQRLLLPADVTSDSCSGAGTCTGVGEGLDSAAVTSSEVAGLWGLPQPVTFANTVDNDAASSLSAVLCPTAGNCTAMGIDASGLFTVSAVAGVWGTAQDLSLGSESNASGGLEFNKVVCTNADTCIAEGDNNGENPFVVVDASGVWGAPQVIAPINGQLMSDLPLTLNCTTSGTCNVDGFFTTHKGEFERFIYVESGGNRGTTSVKAITGALAWAYGNE